MKIEISKRVLFGPSILYSMRISKKGLLPKSIILGISKEIIHFEIKFKKNDILLYLHFHSIIEIYLQCKEQLHIVQDNNNQN